VSWRHLIREALICLLLGVVLTVGVAWVAASLAQPHGPYRKSACPTRWPIRECDAWPPPTYKRWLSQGPASALVQVSHDPPGTPGTSGLTSLIRLSAGWPTCALASYDTISIGHADAELSPWRRGLQIPERLVHEHRLQLPRRFPLWPLWPGFAVDTASYAGLSWVVLFGPFAFRRWRRGRRGGCARCGYDLAGLDACPECGHSA
jgi:hypothetical protein